MSRKTIYSEIESPLSYDDWQPVCPIGEYRIIYPNEYPPLSQSKLLAKAPCAVVACSGSLGFVSYIFQLYRPDREKGKYVIDEHQYVCCYNTTTRESASGYIHHADYAERTYSIDQKMVSYLTGSSSLPVIFPTKVPPTSGSLDELRQLGRIDGLDFCYEYGYSQSVKKGIVEPLPIPQT
ncbi:MAG: hypothetical protein Q8M98_10435 [Candidatus Cloacimonadaceae bacterium]|nr:hypothetical protein [Candidatus Cloacimonadaceae bacterium]